MVQIGRIIFAQKHLGDILYSTTSKKVRGKVVFQKVPNPIWAEIDKIEKLKNNIRELNDIRNNTCHVACSRNHDKFWVGYWDAS